MRIITDLETEDGIRFARSMSHYDRPNFVVREIKFIAFGLHNVTTHGPGDGACYVISLENELDHKSKCLEVIPYKNMKRITLIEEQVEKDEAEEIHMERIK
jgi:hypothetical protein